MFAPLCDRPVPWQPVAPVLLPSSCSGPGWDCRSTTWGFTARWNLTSLTDTKLRFSRPETILSFHPFKLLKTRGPGGLFNIIYLKFFSHQKLLTYWMYTIHCIATPILFGISENKINLNWIFLVSQLRFNLLWLWLWLGWLQAAIGEVGGGISGAKKSATGWEVGRGWTEGHA